MTKKFFQYRFVASFFVLSVLLALGGTIWAYTMLRSTSGNTIIIHFNDIDGITQIGGPQNILYIGFLGLLIIVLNAVLAFTFEERDRVLGKVIAISTLVFAVLLFIAFAAIINVN